MEPEAFPSAPRLSADTRLGRIFLRVRELTHVAAFYQEVLGLEVIEQRRGELLLGAAGRGLVGLLEAPEAIPAPRAPGLYHLALRLPDRSALATFLANAVRRRARLQGASDHGVSEAIYLTDPEGNCLKVYRDRPRDAWPTSGLLGSPGSGVGMLTAPLDSRALLEECEAGSERFEAPAGTALGHVHLRVGDLLRAGKRYRDVVGFTVTQDDTAGALFLAAGDYHHHVGLNIWATEGRPPAPLGALGLAWFEVAVPGVGEAEALRARLAADGTVQPSGSEAFPDTLYYDADGIALAVTEG